MTGYATARACEAFTFLQYRGFDADMSQALVDGDDRETMTSLVEPSDQINSRLLRALRLMLRPTPFLPEMLCP